MARNTELVRQWEVLRAIDGARNGIAVAKLASERVVCQRTIRRDIDALCRAGFPLRDEKVNGTTMWKLAGRPFGRLEQTGLSVTERYASASSCRTKDYLVEPQRLVYAHGGIYVVAWIPEYGQLRTFAAERIETFAVGDERFDPRPLPTEPFADSLGVHTGPPERIVIEFEPDAAPFVRERRWHRSQRIDARPDGGIVLTLDVCNDHALRTWILGFGPLARVVEPLGLAQDIFDAAEQTRRRYMKLLRVQPTVLAMRTG